MSIKINYSKKIKKTLNNLVLFTGEKFKINNLKKYLSTSEFSYINDLLKNNEAKKKLLIFDINSKKKIILISVKKNPKISEVENLGAEFYGKINNSKKNMFKIRSNSLSPYSLRRCQWILRRRY